MALSVQSSDSYAMLMSPNKGETAVHGCHCPGDMAVRMRQVLAVGWCMCAPCFKFVILREADWPRYPEFAVCCSEGTSNSLWLSTTSWSQWLQSVYNLVPRGCDPFGQHQVSEGNEDSGDEIEWCSDLGVKKMVGKQ